MTPEMKRIQDEIRSNNADALKDSVRRMFPEREFSDDALERCSSLLKVASLLGLDPKKLLQPEVDNLPKKDERNLVLSNIGYPIPGCKFGYTYGSHPDATDAQIAAEMEKGGNSTKTGGKLKAGKTNDKPEPQVKEPDPNKEVSPDKTLKPKYIDKNERQKDIARLRDLILAETSNPKEMEVVAASVVNRFQTPKENFGVKKPNTYSDLINAQNPAPAIDKTTKEPKRDKNGNLVIDLHEQFQGFGDGKTPEKVEKIKNSQDAADKENVATATGIAEKAVSEPGSIKRTLTDKDGNSHYVYSFMSKGLNPQGRARRINATENFGNDYFYHAKQ